MVRLFVGVEPEPNQVRHMHVHGVGLCRFILHAERDAVINGHGGAAADCDVGLEIFDALTGGEDGADGADGPTRLPHLSVLEAVLPALITQIMKKSGGVVLRGAKSAGDVGRLSEQS